MPNTRNKSLKTNSKKSIFITWFVDPTVVLFIARLQLESAVIRWCCIKRDKVSIGKERDRWGGRVDQQTHDFETMCVCRLKSLVNMFFIFNRVQICMLHVMWSKVILHHSDVTSLRLHIQTSRLGTLPFGYQKANVMSKYGSSIFTPRHRVNTVSYQGWVPCVNYGQKLFHINIIIPRHTKHNFLLTSFCRYTSKKNYKLGSGDAPLIY